MNVNLSTKMLFTASQAISSRSAGTVNGTAINALALGNWYEEATALINVAAATGTPSSFSLVVKLQESDDDSTYTDVSGVTVTIATTGLHNLDYAPGSLKKYRRHVATLTFVGGTSPTLPYTITEIAASPKVS